MNVQAGDTRVYVVPVIDVNWLTYAPFDPGRGYRVDPPNVPQSILDTRQLNRELRELTDGKFILTPHSGTYCRDAYYEGEMLEVYGECIAGGAEIAVHLHEEIKGAGSRFGERDHVEQVFDDCYRKLDAAGLHPVAYRGGHYAYAPFMNEILEAHEIYADYSGCPGMDYPDREAIWTKAPLNAEMIPENLREPWEGQKPSKVLEIPMGSDGEGYGYESLLHVEMSPLENLQRVWNTISARAETEGRPQLVHCLFHTASVGKPEWLEKYRQFLRWIPVNHGQFVTTEEAMAIFGATRQKEAAE